MRYFLTGDTLFLRGDFFAASTGVNGGLGRITTILNHTVPNEWSHSAPLAYLREIVVREGFSPEFYGLLTAVDMRHLCILSYDFITAFVTAGVAGTDEGHPGTINVIVYSREGFGAAALLETIITVCGAKAEALRCLGYTCAGTPTDAVVVASEGEMKHEFAGTLTPAGSRVHACVLQGVEEALKRHEGIVQREEPSFFIYSRYRGGHWVEWTPEGCPYYPCHFAGQRCDFCYCPFYPCMDQELGDLVPSTSGGSVWSCSRCELVHRQRVAEYLKRNPEASLQELKKIDG
jgi:adenosylcobinamide hydrolase